MAFDVNTCPVTKLTSFYIVGASHNNECYIIAHGGQFDADYVLDNKSFAVPTGVTVNFYQRHGDTFSYYNRTFRNQPPLADPNAPANELAYTAGQQCPNYVLTKRVGRHANSSDPNWDYAGNEEEYQAFQAIAQDAGIVLISVRNRWFHAGMTVKAAIKAVTAERPNITTFNCLFCRVDDASAAAGPYNWSGRRGVRQ